MSHYYTVFLGGGPNSDWGLEGAPNSDGCRTKKTPPPYLLPVNTPLGLLTTI